MYCSCKEGISPAEEVAKDTLQYNHGELAELAEGTSLLTRQGVKTLASSNLALSANAKTKAYALVLLHFARACEIRKTEAGTLWAAESGSRALTF